MTTIFNNNKDFFITLGFLARYFHLHFGDYIYANTSLGELRFEFDSEHDVKELDNPYHVRYPDCYTVHFTPYEFEDVNMKKITDSVDAYFKAKNTIGSVQHENVFELICEERRVYTLYENMDSYGYILDNPEHLDINLQGLLEDISFMIQSGY